MATSFGGITRAVDCPSAPRAKTILTRRYAPALGEKITQAPKLLSTARAALPSTQDRVHEVASSELKQTTALVAREFPSQLAETSSQVFRVPVWDDLPSRKRLTLACAMSFALSNMDKVNLTLCILPMAQDMGWSATTTGLIQSTFFYGLLVMMIPGGALSSKFGGRSVLPVGVVVWSFATFVAPVLSSSLAPFCASRVLMGLGEAVAPSAIVDVLARSVPKEERASSISTAFGGLHVGSIIGLLACPPIINAFGWQAVFYIFGGAGILWYVMFESLIRSLERDEPEAAAKLRPAYSVSTGTTSTSTSAAEVDIPYRAMFRSRPVQVLAATHFAHNWFHYTFLAWLPTYFVSALEVDLMHAAQTSLLPPMAGVLASAAAGTLADGLIAWGMPTATVRKLCQSTAFVLPSILLLIACQAPPDDHITVVALITGALGMSSFSLAGLYCTHQDLSPKYASTLLGMTNVAASIPGIVGVASVGALYEATRSWELSLFGPSALFMMLGTAIFASSSSHDQIDFDAADNTPFAFEAKLEPAKRFFRSNMMKGKVVARSVKSRLGWDAGEETALRKQQ